MPPRSPTPTAALLGLGVRAVRELVWSAVPNLRRPTPGLSLRGRRLGAPGTPLSRAAQLPPQDPPVVDHSALARGPRRISASSSSTSVRMWLAASLSNGLTP